MSDKPELDPRTALAEKLAIQAETGFGRSMARPGGGSGLGSDSLPGGIGSVGLRGGGIGDAVLGTSGMSGTETNDAMPGGGTVGDRTQPDTIEPGATEDGPGNPRGGNA